MDDTMIHMMQLMILIHMFAYDTVLKDVGRTYSTSVFFAISTMLR